MLTDAIKTLKAPLGFGKAVFDFALEFPGTGSLKSKVGKISYVKGFCLTTLLGFKVETLRQLLVQNKTFEGAMVAVSMVRKGCKSLKWFETLHVVSFNETWGKTWDRRLGTLGSLCLTVKSCIQINTVGNFKSYVKLTQGLLGLYLQVYDNKYIKLLKITIHLASEMESLYGRCQKIYYNSDDFKGCKVISSISLFVYTLI